MGDIITGLLVGLAISIVILLITTALNINDMHDDVDELLRIERRKGREHEEKKDNS